MTAPQDFEFDAAYRGETARLGLGARPAMEPGWAHNPNSPR